MGNLTKFILSKVNITNQYREKLETLEVSINLLEYDTHEFVDAIAFSKNKLHQFYVSDNESKWIIWSTNKEFKEKAEKHNAYLHKLTLEELFTIIEKII
ncbi:hypothetical protein D3C81_844440 [compost metagenome]